MLRTGSGGDTGEHVDPEESSDASDDPLPGNCVNGSVIFNKIELMMSGVFGIWIGQPCGSAATAVCPTPSPVTE